MLQNKTMNYSCASKNAAGKSAIYYTVQFTEDGIGYSGRLTPEFKTGKNECCWHVVLNEVFFGYMHKDGNHWEVSEQRPRRLTRKVGFLIDSKSYQSHRI